MSEDLEDDGHEPDDKDKLKRMDDRLQKTSKRLKELEAKVNQSFARTDSDGDSENDARYALLDHCSSKSTNQTTMLLGLAVAFLTIVELNNALSLPFKWQGSVVLGVFLGLLMMGVTRQIGRLLYWGEFATAVMYVRPANEQETEKYINDVALEVPATFKPRVTPPTNLARLNCNCNEFRNEHKKNSRSFRLIWNLTHGKGLIVTYCIIFGAVGAALFWLNKDLIYTVLGL